MNIWIIRNGVTVVYKSFLDLPINKDLVSGLLEALNQFVFSEFNQPIDSINMGGYQWSYDYISEENLLFVAADTIEAKPETIKSRLEFVKHAFLKQYLTNENWIHWKGNVDMFEPFEDLLEQYYYNWQAAESLEVMAEFFDVLRVFQEVFSITKKAIDDIIDPKKKDKVLDAVDKFFDKFRDSIDINKFPELNKISYSRKTGFNLFEIDPNSCDIAVTKRHITNILIEYVNVMKNVLGVDLSIQYFNEYKVFEYISHNLALLKKLELLDFLFKLYLLP